MMQERKSNFLFKNRKEESYYSKNERYDAK